MRLKCIGNFVVAVFVADDYSVRFEFYCLLYEKVSAVVGCQKLDLEKVSVLSDHIKGLSSDGSCGSEYGYASFLHNFS